MRRILFPATFFMACVICGLLLALVIALPTKALNSDLARWIKPEALTDEGRAALQR